MVEAFDRSCLAGILVWTVLIFNRDQKMASGRERSVSIYTLLHLVFHRRKPVEAGIKDKKRRRRLEGGGHYPTFIFVFMCSSCQSCFDVIWLKVIWIFDCLFQWFQRQPQGSPTLDPRLQGFCLHAAKIGTTWTANINVQ